MKTHSELEIRKIFKQQNYKYAALKNAEGKTVVTYNTENNPKVKAADKVNEAFERLKILPDGIYTFAFANSKGRNLQPDEFAFLKGNVAIDENGKNLPYYHIQAPPAHVPSEYEKVLSYPEVMKLQIELATLEMKLKATESELNKANATILEQQKEITELEAKGLGDDSSSPAKWMEMLGTTFVPLYDRYMSHKERELSLQERSARRSQKQQQQQRKPKQQPPPLPEIGSFDFEQFCDQLADLSDEEYQRAMFNIKQASQAHYDAIVEAIETEDTE